jgi:hypothetical protein
LVEENTVKDGTGDVYDMGLPGLDISEQEFVYVTEHPDIDVKNIDIKEGRYIREDRSVTLELEVVGKIEDRGTADLENESYLEEALGKTIESVEYAIELITSFEGSNKSYKISYTNNTCKITYPGEFTPENLSEGDFYIRDQNTLVVVFELEESNETYVNMEINTLFMKMNFSLAELMEDPEDLEDLEKIFVCLMDIAPNPLVEAMADATNLAKVGQSVQFNGTAMFGHPPFTYKWDFGDGETSTERNPTHRYTKPGEYEYTLTVTDSSGNKANSSGIIKIVPVEEDKKRTPGFEFLFAVAALIFILLWKRKKFVD